MILADALYARLSSESENLNPDLYRNLMIASLIHDLARRHDGLCREHGQWAWESKRQIAERNFLSTSLSESEWYSIGQAVAAHSRDDPPGSWPAGSLEALLKDADCLDRVRLSGYPPDPAFLRHGFAKEYLEMAWTLLDSDVAALEEKFFG